MTFRFILLILICFSSISASAQIFDKITRTVEQAFNNEINRVGDKVAERLVEKLIESVFAGQEAPTDSLGMYQVDSSGANNSGSIDLASILGGTNSASQKPEQSYTFDYKLTSVIQSKEHSSSMDMYFPEKGTFSMVEMSSVKILSDHETGDSYTILNGKLTSFNMQKILEKNMAQTNGGPMTVRKTGKTEKIHGYLCYEYILENDEYMITSMVTEEFAPSDIVNAKTIKRMRDEISTDYPGGFALRTINVEKSTGEKTTISVTSISKEQTIVDLSTF